MNDMVRNSIESRKNAIFSAYEINDDALLNKINDLFERIMVFGENCNDVGDFETQFATSSLNQEYIELFTKIATTCSPKPQESSVTYSNPKGTGEQVLDEVKDEMEYQLKDMSLPMRRRARQAAYDQARNTPIIGEVMTAKQHFDFFARFKNLKKKKKDKKDEK